MKSSRQQFEEWFNKDVFSLKLADEKLVNCYWDAWQASRETIEIKHPERESYLGTRQVIFERDAMWLDTIRAAGIKVKE